LDWTPYMRFRAPAHAARHPSDDRLCAATTITE
jgi:hypothetical protein